MTSNAQNASESAPSVNGSAPSVLEQEASPQIEVLPPDNLSSNKQVVASASFSGPLPHPSILKGYNQLVPDAAERILKAFEQQNAHREKVEMAVNKANIRLAYADMVERFLGMILAFVIGLVILHYCYALALSGHDWVAGALATTTLAAVIGLFLRMQSAKPAEPIKSEESE